ncbi:MAG: hypothetical protein AAB316_21765 [Bacteroidota bacterium]
MDELPRKAAAFFFPHLQSASKVAKVFQQGNDFDKSNIPPVFGVKNVCQPTVKYKKSISPGTVQ